jgi:hypothetical protein
MGAPAAEGAIKVQSKGKNTKAAQKAALVTL